MTKRELIADTTRPFVLYNDDPNDELHSSHRLRLFVAFDKGNNARKDIPPVVIISPCSGTIDGSLTKGAAVIATNTAARLRLPDSTIWILEEGGVTRRVTFAAHGSGRSNPFAAIIFHTPTFAPFTAEELEKLAGGAK